MSVYLKYHVLHSYYPLGFLDSIVNALELTLATKSMGAGTYTLNITRVNGSVAVGTGIVQDSITQTFFYQKPLAIFAVPKVILPQKMFGKQSLVQSPNKYLSLRVLFPSPTPKASHLLAIPPTPPNVVPNPPSSYVPPSTVSPSSSSPSIGDIMGHHICYLPHNMTKQVGHRLV